MTSKQWLAIAFAAACTIPSLSHAQVTYDYANGAICQPSTPADASKIVYNTWGVSNISSTQATVMCPISNMSPVGDVRITVYDRNTSTNVCCTIRTHAQSGAVRWASPNRCSSGFGSTEMVLNFGTPPVAGILTAVCTLPASSANGASHVASFRFRE